SVFYDLGAVLFCEGEQWIEIGRMTCVVDRHDDLGARRDGCSRCLWVHTQRVVLDVDQHRPRSYMFDNVGCGGEGQSRDDHFVNRTYTKCHQGYVQDGRARIEHQGSAVRSADVSTELCLEGFRSGPSGYPVST